MYRRTYIDLNANGMHSRRNPQRHSEAKIQGSTNFSRMTVTEIGVYYSLLLWVTSIQVRNALWVQRQCLLVRACCVCNLRTGPYDVIRANSGDDLG